ncbi:MAG: uroporphyrinogen-III C-methyltransferase [Gammaproteobacteria bacterium]|nr:uroporphyrinogen-III C-methyltransferase [Gammaproteobacteria bacterium]
MNEPDNLLEPELNPAEKKSSAWIWIILLLIIALGGACYYVWFFLTERFAQQQDQITTLQSTLSKLETSVKQHDQQIVTSQKTSQTIQDMAQQALDLGNRRQKDWILSEADYLIRIANHRLQISRDINSAIAALQAADQALHETGDLSLLVVRQQLTKDLTALKAIRQIDIDGLVLSLNQMSDQVINLPMKSIDDEIREQLPDTPATDKTDASLSDKILDTIKSIGDIKIHHRGVSPATTEQRHYRNERMLINHLTSARLAALRFDTTQFIYDINIAEQTLKKDYDLNDNRVSQMLKELSALSKIELAPVLPDITKSWRLLQTARNKVKEIQK